MLLRRAWLLAVLVACDTDGSAVTDAAGRDAGRDAALDAGRDAGQDAGPLDSGARDAADAGQDAGPEDPGWVALATLADDCVIERALRPEVLPVPRWAPCAEQPEGCLREVGGSAGGARSTEPAWFDGERGFFQVGHIDLADRLVPRIASTDGIALAAWRTPPIRELLDRNRVCDVRLGVGGGYASIVVLYFDGDDPSRNVGWVYHAPIEAIGTTTEPLTILAPWVAPQRMAVSSEIIAMWTGPTIVAVGADGRQAVLSRGLSGIPQNPRVVGPHVIWEDWAALVRVVHATMDTPAALYMRADPGDIKGFWTDGVEMAWMEGFDWQPDGRYARLELWAAPYARDPADVVPRYVRPMEVRSIPVYGGGWYVMLRGDPYRLEIVRTADGSRREWQPARGALYPLYVSDHEILVDAGELVRIDPHTLPIVE